MDHPERPPHSRARSAPASGSGSGSGRDDGRDDGRDGDSGGGGSDGGSGHPGRPAGEEAADALVLAAGAVLWRRSPATGDTELALVHRPKYDDWSFPKGKLHAGEGAVEAALREVREETGYECVLGAPLLTRRYVAHGRRKQVSYWCATPQSGSFEANEEVDRLIWLPAAVARSRLTHDHDRPLVDAALRAIGAKRVI